MERIGHGVVNDPPRSARHGEIRDPLPRADIDDRYCARTRDGRVADMGDQQPGTPRVVGQTVGPDADRDLLDRCDVIGIYDGDGVLTSI
jgi:hypothetical protein